MLPTVAALDPVLAADTLITADAGYHSEANLAALAQMKREALIPDNGMRSRDERFDDSAKYKQEPDPLHDKSPTRNASSLYGRMDRRISTSTALRTAVCVQPGYGNGGECKVNGYIAVKFRGGAATCGSCTRRDKCRRTPGKTTTRQVAFFIGKLPDKNMHTERMKQRIDSVEGRLYGRRSATIEPVFANLRHNKRLTRFTLRGQSKVDGRRSVERFTG